MNETARTVAKEILEPKIVWIVSLKVLNGIFGKGCCTGEVADANETRFIQNKSQTKAQCWDTSDIADDKNIKVRLKKKVALLYKSVILLSFQLQTHQKKRKKIITLLTQKLPPHLSSLPVLTSCASSAPLDDLYHDSSSLGYQGLSSSPWDHVSSSLPPDPCPPATSSNQESPELE